jgi:hypothetical protein
LSCVAFPHISTSQLIDFDENILTRNFTNTLQNPLVKPVRARASQTRQLPAISAYYKKLIEIPQSNQPDSVLDIEGFFRLMKKQENRLNSFMVTQWPHERPAPSSMAKAGFFFCLLNDTVQCAFCRSCVAGWNEDSKPEQVHKIFFPHCILSEKQRNSNQSTSDSPEDQASTSNVDNLASAAPSANVTTVTTVTNAAINLLEEFQQRIYCKVCYDKEISVRFNCKHIVTCKQCSVRVVNCPICRCVINKRVDVILC